MHYVILPYATTSRPLTIRGITYRSSDDLDLLKPDQAEHVKILCKLFYLQEDLRIKKMSYCVYDEPDQGKYGLFIRKLWESSTCLKYLCTCPNPPRFSAPTRVGLRNSPSTEIAEMFLFHAAGLPAEHFQVRGFEENVEYVGSEPEEAFRQEIDGYTVSTVGRGDYFRIGNAGRIYPPQFNFSTRLAIRYSIDIAVIHDALRHGSKWAIRSFIASESEELTPLEKRILKAVDWYNSSCECSVHPNRSLVFLAIAFEALLNLEWEKNNTERFKDVVMVLLGSIERLDTWLDQFFKARGDIVHTGEATDLLYYPPKGESKQRKYDKDVPISMLTDQGRKIFHLCLDAILAGSVTAREARLDTEFTHDEERIREIFALIDSKDATPPDQRIVATGALVQELCGNIYQTASRVKETSLLNVSSKMMEVYLSAKLQDALGMPSELVEKMQAFIASTGDVKPRARQVFEISRGIAMWHSKTLDLGELPRDEAFDILRSLITYAATHLEGLVHDSDLPPPSEPAEE